MYGGIAGYFPPAKPAAAAAAPTTPPVQPLPVGQLSGGTGPPVPPAPAVPLGGKLRAVTYLRQRLRDIYLHHPQHGMFGPMQVGRLVMPFHDQSRTNSVCWYNAIDSSCSKPMHVSLQIGIAQCWMTKSHSYKINTPKQGGRTTLCKSFKVVRFFAFLMQPSDANWANLRDGQETLTIRSLVWSRRDYCSAAAGLHVYQRRGARRLQYIEPLTRRGQQCKNGARVLCPGHGPNLTKCVFTHPDGTPRPCRNHATQVPVCACVVRCY